MQAKPKNRNLFDKFVLVLGIVESLTTLPQLYQVWVNGQTVGVSVITWAGYCLVECVWLAYGIRQNDKALIGSSISWGLMEALVTVGVLVK
jgi:uncharacterized protein with PQ loop repeat